MTSATTPAMVDEPVWAERFWSKVVPGPDCCLIYTGGLDTYGYGQFGCESRNRKAHQIALQLAGIVVPPGLEPDHRCEVRRCVNVDHLDLVTHAENLARSAARRTHCRSGRHRWIDPGVTGFLNGTRVCLICRNEKRRANYAAGVKNA